jgi:threonylcarbamoyladenosine tRNA methylthiotransferase MtaB
MDGTGKRAAVRTLGCRLNQSETGLIEDRLRAAGYTIVPFGEPADLGIINTCTVTREADAKSRQAIRGFIRRNPDAYTAVVGCYSELGYEALAAIDGIDLIVGTQEKLRVLDHITEGRNGAPVIIRDTIQQDDFTIDDVGTSAIAKRTNLKIQEGCDFMCSYCIIPYARGRARARNLDDLTAEATHLVERGAKELVLTGINVGCYRQDGRDIVDVVERLNAITALERIRISSIEPGTIPEALFAFMDDSAHALAPHLHIPLQSGSGRVLAAMNRRYTREEFLAFLEQADGAVRDLCIGTDIMVGFPGETDADFEASLAALAESPVSYAHIFKYSPREGTPAASLPDAVAPRVMDERGARLRALGAEKHRRFLDACTGRTLPVLFEQVEDGLWCGYTGNYIRAGVRSDEELKNQVRLVRLEEARGELMTGTLHDD